jgi:hypothetical protein
LVSCPSQSFWSKHFMNHIYMFNSLPELYLSFLALVLRILSSNDLWYWWKFPNSKIKPNELYDRILESCIKNTNRSSLYPSSNI